MRNLVALLTICVMMVLYSCNRNAVALDYTNAKDEVPPLGNLTFRFNRALVADSLLDRWDSAEYVSFEPQIAGRFRWEHPDELVFSPARPLKAATSYKAVINKTVLQSSIYGRIENAEDLAFHTPDLKLENTNVVWVLQDEQTKIAVPQIDCWFNYPVNPNTLKEKLQVTIDGKTTDYSLQTLSAANKISLRLLNIRAEDKSYALSLLLQKGLMPEGGTNGTKEAAETASTIPSPFVLYVNEVSSEHDGNMGTITVRTSQQLADANTASFIGINPNVKFSVQLTDDGFVINSDNFNADKSYALTIAKGLRGKVGGVLRETYNDNFAFGALEPSISFTSKKAVYLSAQGERNIEIKISGVPKVKLTVSRIYENNLLAAQQNGYYPRETGANRGGYEDEQGSAVFGDVLYEKEIDTRSLPKYGNSRLLNFNIADQLPDFKGIYHIRVSSAKDYWVSDSRFISLSDIGLMAREGQGRVYVFANSLKTAEPVNGVNVVAYGSNNQLLGMATTNNQGMAEMTCIRKEFAGFRPAMVVARTAGDFNYLPFSSTKVNTSRFEVSGKRSNPTGFDAFIYAERDIYRPGEKVNFSVILRNGAWQPPGEIPLKFKFLLPNGKELKTFRKNLNEQGGAEGSVEIPASAITGSYQLEVYSSNDILLATKPFMIEEFVPDRIKVTAKLDKPFLKPGESVILGINAVNFFGPPAANRNYETEIQLKQKSFNPKKYNKYDFTLANQNTFFDKVVKEGKTDVNGNASETYLVPATYSNIGVLQSTFYATVFDETGRPVSRSAMADIFTQDIFLGLRNDEAGYYPLHQTIQFPVVAIDKNEALVNGAKATIRVIKHEYRTVLAKSGSYFRYDSQKQDKLLADNLVTITGENTMYRFVPLSPGEYEVRLSLPGATSYVSRSFYSYGSWGADNNAFEVNNEGNIDIATDKPTYLAGESAKVLFTTPFSGKMLVTMETDKVLWQQYVNVEKHSVSLNLPLTAAHLPNVYITATLFKPHAVSDIPLTVAHGFQNIMVEEKSRKMRVDIVAATSTRSKMHQQISVQAAPGSYITLAAVDNGVLQVSGFKTPDPYGYFYGRRALEVNSYDLYALLFPELRARLSSTGGDADLAMNKRTNPMPNKRIKIVSYWSGIVKANGSGRASFDVDIPAFSGQVRLMAVAYKGTSFGSAEASMTVADPLVLSMALPRFLSPRDTVSMPVTLSNTTAKSASAVATITVTGALQVAGKNSEAVTIPANSEARAVFKVVAANTIAAGKVLIEVKAMGERFTDETDITVRPASTLQQLTRSGSITGNNTQPIVIGTGDFMPGSAAYRLVVSPSPVLEVASQLQYLEQFPFGCTEQVVSTAFPQLYYSDLMNLVRKNAASINSNENIQQAIRTIKMRQLYNGAVLLWDNEGTENWWVSVYAAQFLLEAQKAGYDVDQSLIETLLGYIDNRLKKRQTISYYFNRNQQKKIAPKEVAYGLYVLATAGRPDISVMNYYKANPQVLSLDSRYLLSAAYAVAGDKAKFRELLPSAFSGEESVAQTGGSFYSDIRDEAIALNVLIDVDPGNAQVPIMARHVVDKLKQRTWYTTQESAFSLLALGKLARASRNSTITADITVNGKVVGKMNGTPVRLTARELGSTNAMIITRGQGRLYYWWQSEGISLSGSYKEEDNYLKVRRTFFDRFGRTIQGSTFHQNDLVIVRVTVEKPYAGTIDNVVVTDILPAGFEIENPRTKEIPGMEWIKESDTPTQLDVRDDRINLFIDVSKNKQTYYYAVRAVSPGVYRMGPVSADALYNGEYHSYNGGGVVEVLP